MTIRPLLWCGLFAAVPIPAISAIVVSGASNKTAVAAGTTVTVAVNAEAGFNIVATLDGLPLTLGVAVQVTAPQYHEVKEVKTPTAGGAATTNLYQFIIRSAGRSTTEDGLPAFTPPPLVNDAPSAFAGQTLLLVAPRQFPKNTPIPLIGMLRNGVGDPLWLNGVVRSGNYPHDPLQLRRGWGSLMLPAQTAAGTVTFDGTVGPVSQTAAVQIEDTTTWTTKTGTVGSETWGPNGRIDVTGNLTLTGTLTVLPDTIIRLAQGVSITVNEGAELLVAATSDHPACFVAQSMTKPWGGIWLAKDTAAAGVAKMTTTGAIFSSYGNNYAWYPGTSGYNPHRDEEALVLIDNNAICNLTDTYIIDGRGQAFHMDNGNLSMTRSLVHRATTGGEFNRGQFDLDRCAFIEFYNRPNGASNVFLDESGAFFDGDNDGMYLIPYHNTTTNVPKTWTINKTLIGWTLDDGIDTGGSNDGVTVLQNSWIESCYHEAMSHSGTNRVPRSLGSVHLSSGQGFECGYDGPLSYMNGSLVLDCMVGTRFGDNYVSGFTYGGTLTVENSLILNNRFHDVWGMAWNTVHGDSTKAWTYNSQWMTINNNYLTEANSYHPNNTLWNPTSHAPLLAPFMPVPNAQVGTALVASKFQDSLANFPGKVTARLSTFSSLPVAVSYEVVGKSQPDSSSETMIATGTFNFAPGQVSKEATATLPGGNTFGVVVVRLHSPQNAAITGEDLLYYKTQTAPPNQTLIAMSSTGWSYSAIRAEPAAGWTGLGYTEQAAQWQTNKLAPIGFGQIGSGTAGTFTPGSGGVGTALTAAESGSSTDRTRAVYYRKKFSLTNAAYVSGLTVNLVRDDGAVVYFNGYEAFRNNIDSGSTPGGTISYSTFASSNINGDAEFAVNSVAVPTSIFPHLVEGENVIVVEVHQIDAGSSDLVLDLSLVASFGAPSVIPSYGIGDLSGQPFFYWLDPSVIMECSSDLQTWLPEPTATSPVFPVPSPNYPRMFYRLRKP